MHGLLTASICSNLVVCLGAWVWRTDLIFPMSKPKYMCRLGYDVYFTAYGMSKMLVYLLLAYRLEKVFEESAYAVSKVFLLCFRSYIVIAYLILQIVYLVSAKVTIYSSKTYHIRFCMTHVSTTNYVVLSLIPVFDVSTTMVMTPMLQDATSFQRGFDLYTASNRATILICVSSLSIWCFVLVGTFGWADLRFFISLDCTIHSICVFCIFKFGDDIFGFCCKCCSRFCFLIFAEGLQHDALAMGVEVTSFDSSRT
ncbi:hypothetical protein RFI_03394 [Reticulomyxa filosa]|uniref:Uncharacterized protein n=1 Tax=Reticulomyxa filosa TaxID=46433 RepID=X6P586_RETFI|nr:hypothetical protein RFI_03394 [Reticulomyxa filosa]|eukprot:ETO33710.1 hypothetical protein RFI_03394 [Reticulomyxa filosa]